MGLYIPNAKIPVSCNKCYDIGLAHRLRDLGGHCPRMDLHYSPDEQDFKGDRRADCPLLDVPTHGRLGDLDKQDVQIEALIERHLHGYTKGTWDFVCEMRDILKRNRTIIPADPAEEGE